MQSVYFLKEIHSSLKHGLLCDVFRCKMGEIKGGGKGCTTPSTLRNSTPCVTRALCQNRMDDPIFMISPKTMKKREKMQFT